MVHKLIAATAAKPGTSIIVDGVPCTVKSNDISKTGKHGHAKCRMEAVGILDDKKRVLVVPGDSKLEVPSIEKRKGQILSVSEKRVSLMDLESFETIDVPFSEELKEDLAPEKQVEYWDVEGQKSIRRVL